MSPHAGLAKRGDGAVTQDNVKALYAYLMQCEECDGVELWIELDGPEDADPDVVRVVCAKCGDVLVDLKDAEDTVG